MPGWAPRRPPARERLAGSRVALEPLDPIRHAAGLYRAGHEEAGDARLWAYLPEGPFTREEFGPWLAARAVTDDPLFFTIADAGGEPAGMCAFMRIAPEHGVIEIGSIWFAPRLQRTAAATEAIFLLARHAFDELGYRRLEWKCNADNARSRRAAERFGFSFEGVFRQHMVVRGKNRDTAWFAILDGDWPAVRAGFERWLAEDNFGADGGQRASLETLRASAQGSAGT